MMNIDWSKAPKGYDFYIVDKDCCQPPAFHKKVGKKYIDEDGCFWPVRSNIEVYERPTKPAAPEWDGEGLPPVGCECEVRGAAENWCKCKVVGHHDNRAVFFCDCWLPDSDYDALSASEFRPIGTKKQREKEELLDALAKPLDGMMLTTKMKASIADAILSKYELKERNND